MYKSSLDSFVRIFEACLSEKKVTPAPTASPHSRKNSSSGDTSASVIGDRLAKLTPALQVYGPHLTHSHILLGTIPSSRKCASRCGGQCRPGDHKSEERLHSMEDIQDCLEAPRRGAVCTALPLGERHASVVDFHRALLFQRRTHLDLFERQASSSAVNHAACRRPVSSDER